MDSKMHCFWTPEKPDWGDFAALKGGDCAQRHPARLASITGRRAGKPARFLWENGHGIQNRVVQWKLEIRLRWSSSPLP
jgi:hypothetical protein